ncbi:hypothetical protein BDB01DRAFT_797520 [Pilobolus umbonatus]|nr:hypothetical protein BDB01DRAFT_797520 [Pilobolus umbonatus]
MSSPLNQDTPPTSADNTLPIDSMDSPGSQSDNVSSQDKMGGSLPSPLLQYNKGHIVPLIHPSYYSMYHQGGPVYYPVNAQQQTVLMPQYIPVPIDEWNNKKENNKSLLPQLLPKVPYINPSVPPASYGPHYYHPYLPLPSPHNNIQSSSTTSSAHSTADQREKARKITHSAIERRRREKMNDKILQLKELIPGCAQQENLHKLSILQSAIDYITHLKSTAEMMSERTENSIAFLTMNKTKSMIAKEIEPFTTQFFVQSNKTIPPQATPMTPPQEPLNDKTSEKHMSLSRLLC